MKKLSWVFLNDNIQRTKNNDFIIKYAKGVFYLYQGILNYNSDSPVSSSPYEEYLKNYAFLLANSSLKVKRLNWSGDCKKIAKTPFGEIVIHRVRSKYRVFGFGMALAVVSSLPEAYKIANSEYVQRVLSALA